MKFFTLVTLFLTNTFKSIFMNKYLLFPTFLFVSISAFSQIGISVGVSKSSFINSFSCDQIVINNIKSHDSFYGGLTYNFPLSSVIILQSGIFYSEKGAHYSSNFSGKVAQKISFVEVPLIGRLQFELNRNHWFIMETGLFVNHKLKTKLSDETTASTTFSQEENSSRLNILPSKFKNYEFGLNCGAGYSLDKITFLLRYSLGMTNLVRYEDTKTNGKNLEQYSRQLSFSLQYTL